MPKTVIEALHISKKYGKKQVLEDINLRVESGRTVALVGHNGCGKSTFLRILGNLTTSSGGSIDRHSGIKIAYIPERFPKSDFTARDYSVYMGMLDGLSKEAAREKAARLFRDFFMESMADKPMRYLSKGTLQKTAVIQSLLTEPDLLLMDEPLSGQDAESQNIFMDRIKDLGQKGMAVVMSCHENKLIDRLADEVYRIENGKMERIQLEGSLFEENAVFIFERENGGPMKETERDSLPGKVLETAGQIRTTRYQIKIQAPVQSGSEILMLMIGEGYQLREMRNV